MVRSDSHTLNSRFCLFDIEQRLGALRFEDGDLGFVGSYAGLHVLFQLSEAALGVFEREVVLLGVDRAFQLILADVEFSAAHIVTRVKQRNLIIRGGNRPIVFGFGDLFIGHAERGLCLLEVIFLLAGIEFEDNIARLDDFTGLREVNNLKGSPDRWSH